MAYLIQKNGTYWFQIRVPNTLVPRYGAFIRYCLQTKEQSVAQPIALQLAGQWLARFSVEKHDPAIGFEQATPFAPPGSPPDPFLQPGTGQPPIPWPGYGYAPQQIPPHSVVPPSVPGHGYPPHPSLPTDQVQSPPQVETSKKEAKPSANDFKTIDEVYEYWRSMRPDLSKSTIREVQTVIKEFKKVIRKRPADLERLDIAAFRDKLISGKLARSTVSKKIGFISTLLQAAYDGGRLPQNVARGLRIPKARIPDITRRSFTTQELKRIFTSPAYTKSKRLRSCGGEALVWVPLIALATGARLEEICQLRVDDITMDDEHGPLIRITDEGEEQMLKTASSRRTIPVHPELVRAGLLDYHEAVSDRGYEWLFPELEPDHDGRRGGTFGQGFSRYLRSSRGCGIIDKRVVFHSFRHTFKTLCREADLSEELHDALTGHVGQTVGRSYGHMPLSALVKAVARIRFPIQFPKIES